MPAVDLQVGDLVNTAPGEGDWQQVIGVYRSAADSAPAGELSRLVESLGGRYVVVQLTDLVPVDGGIYFAAGIAMVAGDDEGDDQPVTDVGQQRGRRAGVPLHEVRAGHGPDAIRR